MKIIHPGPITTATVLCVIFFKADAKGKRLLAPLKDIDLGNNAAPAMSMSMSMETAESDFIYDSPPVEVYGEDACSVDTCFEPISDYECPNYKEYIFDVYQGCNDDVPLGELCEADGECGTDNDLNNCPYLDFHGYNPDPIALDIYRRVTCEHYNRVLSDFNERHLFALMEGEELEHHLLKYEEKKDQNTSLGLCHNKGSPKHGRTSTHNECFDPTNQDPTLYEKHQPVVVDDDYTPWAVPSVKASLLAKNPGIWSIENFLTDGETDKLTDLINKHGHERGLFGPCKDDTRSPVNAHPSTGKVCFKISPDNLCEGPYDISTCSTKTTSEDSKFVVSILSKFKNLWSTTAEPHQYVKFQISNISQEGTAPVDLHADRNTISFVLYLNDGGAAMVFPNAGVTIEPKKGTVHTWLNTHKDRTPNRMADHAVQAHPKDSGERGVMLLSFEVSPKNILAAAK